MVCTLFEGTLGSMFQGQTNFTSPSSPKMGSPGLPATRRAAIWRGAALGIPGPKPHTTRTTGSGRGVFGGRLRLPAGASQSRARGGSKDSAAAWPKTARSLSSSRCSCFRHRESTGLLFTEEFVLPWSGVAALRRSGVHTTRTSSCTLAFRSVLINIRGCITRGVLVD